MSTEDRQKQIDIIARSFSMQSHAGDPRSFSEGIELGFKAGAAWADRNPANKWHDVSEPPKPNKWFIYEAYAEDQDPEYGAYFSAELEPITWGRMTFANEITRWAYVSDLLPKGGAK